MKKYLSAAIAFVLALSLAACDSAFNEQSEASSEDSSASEIVYASLEASEREADKERIAELEAELAEKSEDLENFQNQLKALREDYDERSEYLSYIIGQLNEAEEKVLSLEKQLSDLKSSVKTRGIYNSNYRVSLEWHYYEHKTWLTLNYLGEQPIRITEDQPFSITYIALSPNIKQVVYSDFEWEATTTVYLRNIESKTTRTLDLSGLPANRTAAGLQWLDDRYFMFVVQFDAGTIVVGGDVYVYDTETDKYQPLIVNSLNPFQTYGIESYEKLFVIKSYLYEETYNFTTEKYHTLTADEIYSMINSNKTIDLSLIKPINE